MIRVGERFSKSNIPFSIKHPIILSKKDSLTLLTISQAHTHQRYMMVLFRRWHSLDTNIGQSRHQRSYQIIRSYRCVTFFRYNSRAHHQPQVTVSRPFLHSGMDFAMDRSPQKFIQEEIYERLHMLIYLPCYTKAIRIEYVSDLSTIRHLSNLTDVSYPDSKNMHSSLQ